MNPSLKGLLNDFSDALGQIRAKAEKGRFAIEVITSDYCFSSDDQTNIKALSLEFNRFKNLAEIAFDYIVETENDIQNLQETINQSLQAKREAAADENS